MFGMGPMELLFVAIMMAILVWPGWRICTKAGLPGPLGLLAIGGPPGILILLLVLAFIDWPALKSSREV
jgi:energy-converting hydrogenase Eha subunit B